MYHLIKGLIFCICLFSVGACRTGVLLKSTPLGLVETKKAIVEVIGNPRKVERGGRELISQYHDSSGEPFDDSSLASERYYTSVLIQGERRPYDLEVEVVIETKNEMNEYEAYDRSDGMAYQTVEKIRKALNQSREKRNLLDDFRPF